MAESNRLPWIDALKGFGIVLVVLAHVRPWRPLEIYIYTFHMCMFFFISGFLFKDERNLKTFTKKKVKALPSQAA